MSMYVSALDEKISEHFGFAAPPKGFAFMLSEKGALQMRTPTGAEVVLDPNEEKEIAKESLKENMRLQMTAWERRKDSVVSSGLNAAGYAVGVAVAGIALAAVFRWLGGRQKDMPKVG